MKACNLIKHRDGYPWGEVQQGLRNAGCEFVSQYIDADVLVTWLPWSNSSHHHAGEFHKSQDKLWIVMENGYIPHINGQRYYAVDVNGYNGNGLGMVIDHSSDRWDNFNLAIEPWKENGEAILVIGQFGHQDTRYSMSRDWPDDIITRLRKITDRPIIYRPKPIKSKFPQNSYANVNVDNTTPLMEQLDNAHAIVTWNSPSITNKALLKGIPVFIDAPNCIAKKLSAGSLLNIEDPKKLPREQFFYNLAYLQWSKEEIKQGLPFKLLQKGGY